MRAFFGASFHFDIDAVGHVLANFHAGSVGILFRFGEVDDIDSQGAPRGIENTDGAAVGRDRRGKLQTLGGRKIAGIGAEQNLGGDFRFRKWWTGSESNLGIRRRPGDADHGRQALGRVLRGQVEQRIHIIGAGEADGSPFESKSLSH